MNRGLVKDSGAEREATSGRKQKVWVVMKEEDGIVAETLSALLADLTDRRGLSQEWYQIDKDIRDEIKAKWSGIIRAGLDTGTSAARARVESTHAEYDRMRSCAVDAESSLAWIAGRLAIDCTRLDSNGDATLPTDEQVEAALLDRSARIAALEGELQKARGNIKAAPSTDGKTPKK